MSDEAPSTFERILVALDGSPHSRAALDAAVRLASAFESEILGLFVEDKTLLRTAELPLAQEVRAYTSSPTRLDNRRVKRQLRYREEYAEWMLQHSAEQRDVPYDFEVVEGNVTQVLLEATSDVDLVVLGKASTASSRRRLGTTSETILTTASSHVLVLRESIPDEGSLLSYYDGSDRSRIAVTIATTLARRAESPLTILLPDDANVDATSLQEEIGLQPQEPNIPVFIQPVSRVETLSFSGFARRKGGLVILPAGCAPLHTVSVQQFLYEIDRPLLVVRSVTNEESELNH